MPKWWVYTYLACCLFAVVYAVLMPSIPYGSGYFHGLLGYSSRDAVNHEVAVQHGLHAASMEQIASLPYAAIKAGLKTQLQAAYPQMHFPGSRA
jgi:cytochrome c oxidase cbb3-type subunit 3